MSLYVWIPLVVVVGTIVRFLNLLKCWSKQITLRQNKPGNKKRHLKKCQICREGPSSPEGGPFGLEKTPTSSRSRTGVIVNTKLWGLHSASFLQNFWREGKTVARGGQSCHGTGLSPVDGYA